MTPNASPIDLRAAYDECQAITRRAARNFYYAFVTLPKPRRRSIYAAYAFSRLADDIADGDADVASRSAALADLRLSLHTALAGAPDGAIMTALADSAKTYDIPESLFNDIIDGVEMDLTKSRYATFDELREYCYRVASAVGLVSIQIFGYTDPQAKAHAVDLGLAMQLTNIMRDVGEDIANDRIYLPQDELARFNVTEEQLRTGKVDANFTALMQFQAQRARSYFASSLALFPLLEPRSRGCATGLHQLYAKLLDRIESRAYDVFSQRVSLPAWQKLRLTFTLWLANAAPRPWRR
jgi:15-cis-phytoene synthase